LACVGRCGSVRVGWACIGLRWPAYAVVRFGGGNEGGGGGDLTCRNVVLVGAGGSKRGARSAGGSKRGAGGAGGSRRVVGSWKRVTGGLRTGAGVCSLPVARYASRRLKLGYWWAPWGSKMGLWFENASGFERGVGWVWSVETGCGVRPRVLWDGKPLLVG
jgi:hypothetical protein